MSLKPIRSEEDYRDALAVAKKLMPKTDDASVDRLEVIQALIEQWESKQFPMVATPAQAIRFRMDQMNLKPRELIPLLGSKSRVSEILAGERQPTVDQIRALNRHLGIPLEPLIGGARHESPRQPSTASVAAVEKLRTLGVMRAKETIDAFLARVTAGAPALGMARKSRTERTNAKTDLGALEAWCAGILVKAEGRKLPGGKPRRRDAAFARDLAKLSREEDGPAQAVEFLAQAGIIFVTLDHLPGTFLDGAAICRGDGTPVIGLTLRHDRLDNFWFTLLHEVAHAAKHLGKDRTVILDDLDVNAVDGIEAEADAFARDALLPPKIAKKCLDPELSTIELMEIADEAEVHPAIVAGRWRWQHRDYRKFSRLLGRGEVRANFPA